MTTNSNFGSRLFRTALFICGVVMVWQAAGTHNEAFAAEETLKQVRAYTGKIVLDMDHGAKKLAELIRKREASGNIDDEVRRQLNWLKSVARDFRGHASQGAKAVANGRAESFGKWLTDAQRICAHASSNTQIALTNDRVQSNFQQMMIQSCSALEKRDHATKMELIRKLGAEEN